MTDLSDGIPPLYLAALKAQAERGQVVGPRRALALITEIERLREALAEIRTLTGRDPLLVGFAHGAPSRQEFAERLDHIRAVSEAAFVSTPHPAPKGPKE